MEIKFKGSKKKIALKDENNKVIDHIYINPNNVIERNTFIRLFELADKELEEIKKLGKKLKDKSEVEIITLSSHKQMELYEKYKKEFVKLWGEPINKLCSVVGEEFEVLATLIEGISPYYKELSKANIDKYTKEK